MPASNFKILITSDDKSHFDAAIKMAFDNASGGKAVAYRISDIHGLILYSRNSSKSTPLPFPMTYEASKDFAWQWLKQANCCDYDKPINHDGDDKEGFCIYNEDYRRVDSENEAFIAIKPHYLMYGK